LRQPPPAHVRLVKGSHIVVPRLFEHDHAYIFQNADGRIVFAIPYERGLTLIGTTDLDFKGDLAAPAASPDEITYLCRAASVYFRHPVLPDQVMHAFAGVRQLYDDGASRAKDLTREYVLELQARAGQAPLLTIYGGKITTYRRLAEAALQRLAPYVKLGTAWTADAALPGGDFPYDGVEALTARARGLWPFLAEANARRLVRAYGTRLDRILGDARRPGDLGKWFSEELSATEVRYLMRHEFAETADDVLWRRSKLGLRMGAEAGTALTRFMEASAGRAAAE
jgi:glycerol-3-phosphate dehydrogenase